MLNDVRTPKGRKSCERGSNLAKFAQQETHLLESLSALVIVHLGFSFSKSTCNFQNVG